MSDLEQLLTDYGDLIQRCRALIEQEIDCVKTNGELDEALSRSKQEMIPRLESELQRLREWRQSNEVVPSDLRDNLDHLQHQFMLVLKLDRELEKTYLAQQHGRKPSSGQPTVDRARAKRMYGAS